ncbi:disease resistance protein RPM1-like isoform X1 [Quercus robur]|uniref:disease resistance protein RPM1-like isoform X1 n=1 Tax=Quercus robur TaxID=38942 RepID=UPI002162B10A|nr:disease resistance protein RPM1-like isoform X1 [Quercus robur]XP_050254162.1 disease resistance protein RPM1-like isoform X1 [Quercus robur]
MESAIVELLIDNIISALATKASLLWGVRDAIADIKHELTSMRSLLIDVDKRGSSSAGEETWVTNVRNTAYDVEDVIDMFMYHVNSQQIGGRFAWFLHHTIYIPQTFWVRHKIACKLQNINKTIKTTSELNQKYHVDPIEGKSSEYFHKWVVRHAESSLFVEEDELVGIKDKRKQLMMWLMDREQQTVISILGMGGSGKTTLVANIYNNDAVKRHFDCYAWITVSQKYDVEDLLRSMIKEFYESKKETNPSDLSSMNYRLLVNMLVSYLEKKSYLIVLDDVWDTNVLDELKVSLRDRYPGSKIILTTREDDVAHHPFMGIPYVHCIQLLEPDEAWELFCKKAFLGSPNRICPPELKSFAQELVRKCKGLPLAIAALGSLMYSKNDTSQWNQINSSLNWNLSNNPELEAVKSILLLSFNDLPYQLKHCFLYCSLFPEDYGIQRKRLIKLWIAEGFVEKFEGSTLEEVADSYLLKLTFRNMLQVVERNEFGRPRKCKMHDIVRELALSISVKENFGVVHDGGEEMIECKARRISIHQTNGEVKSFTGMSKLRSFLVFNKSLKALPLGCKLLRVLDLEDAPIDVLPDEVFKLFNLRYLNLRRTLIKKLPNSIGRLLNLQTLDIRDTQIEALPHGIAKLQNLRHLIMYRFTRNWNDFRYLTGMQILPNISRLKNLQTVGIVEAKGDFIRKIRSMGQLNSIGISNVKEGDEKDLCVSIENMRHLRALTIMVTNEEETLRMDALSSPPPNLQKLFLTGKLKKVPQWFCSLQSLTYLLLRWSRLEEDVLPHIAALPHLGALILTNAYVGKQLCFSTGFLKLTQLWIRNFPQLNDIIIEKGVMPNLKNLVIDSCMELKTVPNGIEYLQNLRELFLTSVSMELKIRIGNMDIPKVQHIPKRYIWYNSECFTKCCGASQRYTASSNSGMFHEEWC